MSEQARRITPVRAEPAAWAPFGWLPVADTDPTDGDHRLAFAWDDAHVNVIGHLRSEVTEVGDALRCDALYRHDTHTQVLMVLDHDAVLAVAPAAVDFSSPEDLMAVTAFAFAPLEPFVLHRGTWHWGPFPRHADVVRLFNVQGLRYSEDNARADLSGLGPPVDVVVS